MTIDKDTAISLARLYGTREHLQRQRERAASSRNIWMGFVDRGAAPAVRIDSTGDRPATDLEQIVEAIGGHGVAADIIMRAVVDHFERMESGLDKEISDLDGAP